MWNIILGGSMLSSLGLNSLSFNQEELEQRYVIRRLMSYGVTPSGDIVKDKQILRKIENGELEPVQASQKSKVDNFTENADYSQTQVSPARANMEESRIGADNLGILNKLKLGLL